MSKFPPIVLAIICCLLSFESFAQCIPTKINSHITGIGSVSLRDTISTLICDSTTYELILTALDSAGNVCKINDSLYYTVYFLNGFPIANPSLMPFDGCDTLYINKLDTINSSSVFSLSLKSKWLVGDSVSLQVMGCNNACLDTINVISNILKSETYVWAKHAVIASSKIDTGSNVQFKAADCIELKNGFEVGLNTDFEAVNDSCH